MRKKPLSNSEIEVIYHSYQQFVNEAVKRYQQDFELIHAESLGTDLLRQLWMPFFEEVSNEESHLMQLHGDHVEERDAIITELEKIKEQGLMNFRKVIDRFQAPQPNSDASS